MPLEASIHEASRGIKMICGKNKLFLTHQVLRKFCVESAITFFWLTKI